MTQTPFPPEPMLDEKPRYPIVESRELLRPERTGPMKIGPRVRRDVARPSQGHYVLVYKVDNRYVVDNMSLDGRDDKVVRAAQVTVVDMRRYTPVEVELTIPSSDYSTFTVVVTFACTVTDPVAVVEGGIIDPGTILLTYVKSHHGYSQMGLGFSISEVNEARVFIDAQLTAYATVNEPIIDGLSVMMASVEVRTPQEMEARAASQRSMRNRHTIESERVDLEGDLQSQRQRSQHGHRMAGTEQEQELDYRQRQYRRFKEREEQEHSVAARHLELQAELERMGMTEAYRRRELQEAAELLADNPIRALQLAYLSGKLDAGELAERMRAGQERDREIEQAAADRERGAARERRRDDEARRQDELTYDRDVKRAKVDAKRAEALRKAEEARLDTAIERDLNLRRLAWPRQDELDARHAATEREQAVLAAKAEIARKIVDRGLLDTSSNNLEEMLRLDGSGLAALHRDEPPAELPNKAATTEGGENDT